MKKLFYIGLIGLLLFEISNVYFIMPMPGSQQFNALPLAYFLYSFRWLFRVAFAFALALGLLRSEWKNKRIVQVQMNQSNVFVVLLSDSKSFFAYENPFSAVPKLINNTLVIDADKTYTYQLNGHGINGAQNLMPVKAYQEFLHSWKHFSQE